MKPLVFIYAGHHGPQGTVLEGPYGTSVELHASLFEKIFEKVQRIYGEHLVEVLSKAIPAQTLLVIPSGAASTLDTVFSDEQIATIQKSVEQGMQLYASCGSAYWLAENRVWHGQSAKGKINLFPGTAIGPLSPCSDSHHHAPFLHKSVAIKTSRVFRVLLSGGGTFMTNASVKVLATYEEETLQQHAKSKEWEKAIISCTYGKGKAILSMVHPEEGLNDVDVFALHHLFAHRTENWQEIHDSLSSEEMRIDLLTEILEEFT